MTTIPKKGKSESPSDFRPISVSNVLSIIFESLLLLKMNFINKINPNQFGYKKTSCKHVYYVVNEVLNYYRERKTKFYIASIDASKAFDKLWRPNLFYKLINLIDECIWRILYIYYFISKICIKFNGYLSDPFKITEGVKQGGKLTSYLFNLYVNDLIDECLKLNLGAKTGNIKISYCYDIIILSSLSSHIQQLLDKIFDYFLLWKIEFNAKK